jgi:GNAT superfamily N-acetyltransferase
MAKAIFERLEHPEGQDLGNGRRMVEGPMPEETRNQHTLRSYGTPRRVSFYDDNAKESFAGPYLKEDEGGEKGLVGYADIYREPDLPSAIYGTQPNGRKIINFTQNTNVGYMRTAGKYQGGGIGRQMFNYVVNTTTPKSHIDLGRVVDERMGHMWEQHKEQGDTPYMHGKVWY